MFDGVVLEIDLSTNLENNIVVNNLWMPHNICFLGGSLTVLDSLRGELKLYYESYWKIPAFTRGLDLMEFIIMLDRVEIEITAKI